MSDLRYPAKVWQDAEGRDGIVKFRDLPGSNTGAAAEAEALTEGADCLGSYLAQLMAERKPVPKRSAAKRGERMIAVPLWIAPKLALYAGLRENSI